MHEHWVQLCAARTRVTGMNLLVNGVYDMHVIPEGTQLLPRRRRSSTTLHSRSTTLGRCLVFNVTSMIQSFFRSQGCLDHAYVIYNRLRR
jgi:hypothetical protein